MTQRYCSRLLLHIPDESNSNEDDGGITYARVTILGVTAPLIDKNASVFLLVQHMLNYATYYHWH